MQRVFASLFSTLSLAILGCVIPVAAKAQVTPDGTTATTVNQDGNNYAIEQGDRVGDNLFHSFDEFSIPTGGSAGFNNAADVVNIFSRVTGGNISNIDGLLRANGAANLFLLNPNGIILGENARLDLGGSFFASTADSLLFEGDAEFSASNPQAAPLLEVSIPIGLSFRDRPGDIVNRSLVQNSAGESVGLEVASGNNLTLLGGDINFDAGGVTAREGDIELGGLSEAGIVSIGEDGRLNFPANIAKADINLSNRANVKATGRGNVAVNARNLNLSAGELGFSSIRVEVTADSASTQAQAGDVSIDVADKITVDGSLINNDVAEESIGDGGNITIRAGSLELLDGGEVNARTLGRGDAGAVEVTATRDIIADGEDSNGIPSGITSQINQGAEGDSGDVTISTNNLALTAGGQINASTFGRGNAGAVEVTARGDISIDGEDSGGSYSGITSQVTSDAEGNAGGVTISTNNLALTAGGQVDADTFGRGDAGAVEVTARGNISVDGEDLGGVPSGITSRVNQGAEGDSGGVTISTNNLNLTTGGRINASTFGRGNAGAVRVTATGNISIDGEDLGGIYSGIASQVAPNAEGDSGDVTISTNNLALTAGGRIDASTGGRGNAGAVEVTATGDISIDGENSSGLPSGITSLVDSDAEGDSGDVIVSTNNLNLTTGGQVDASTLGRGNAGAVKVTATGDISADGENSNGIYNSSIASLVTPDAEGDSGGVTISTDNLDLTAGSQINASTFSRGDAGAVEVTATGDISVDGENSGGLPSSIASVVNQGAGNAGGVTISTNNLALTAGGEIDASTGGQGNAGAVRVTATGDISVDGEDSGGIPSGIYSLVIPDAEGNAGGVTISSNNLALTAGGQVSTSTFGRGDAGAVEVTATGDISAYGEDSGGSYSGIASLVGTDAEGNSGGVTISTNNLALAAGGRINAGTFSQGNAGDVTIEATESIFISGLEDSGVGISSNAVIDQGNSGDIDITTEQLAITDNGIIQASNFDFQSDITPGTGEPGNITIQATSLDLASQGVIGAATQSTTGVRGVINLDISESITLRENSVISAQAFNNANGGNLTINADRGFILAFPNGNNDIIANAEQGNGGRINIDTQAIFGLEERSSTLANLTNDIDASSEFGLQGDFTLNTPDFDPTSGLLELPTSVGDASDQISQNPCQQVVGSHFIVTGKGGLPPNPTDSLGSSGVEVGLVEPQEETGRQEDEETRREKDFVTETAPAMGWTFNSRGEVTLIADSNTNTDKVRSPQDRIGCQSSISP